MYVSVRIYSYLFYENKDIVVIPANGTSISTRLHLVHGEWKYSEKLVTSDNLPNPPDEGMQASYFAAPDHSHLLHFCNHRDRVCSTTVEILVRSNYQI